MELTRAHSHQQNLLKSDNLSVSEGEVGVQSSLALDLLQDWIAKCIEVEVLLHHLQVHNQLRDACELKQEV